MVFENSQKLFKFCTLFYDFCIAAPEDHQFLIETCSVSELNKGLCLTEIVLVCGYEKLARFITG
jgi:hypothetical protein